MTNKAEQTPSFEQDMVKLDMIVRQLEQGELALDDALKVFEEKKELFEDFEFPDVADNVLKMLPFAFFGGEGAVTSAADAS